MLKDIDKGMSLRRVRDKYSVSLGTVQDAQRKRSKIKEQIENAYQLTKKRMCKETELNSILHQWFCGARAMGFPITGPILQEKTRQIAVSVGKENFAALEGWLSKWKTRYNVKSYNICGESDAIDKPLAETWKANLNQLCHGYDLADIFNMNETGYFF